MSTEKAREFLSGITYNNWTGDVKALAALLNQARREGVIAGLRKAANRCGYHEERIVHTTHRDGLDMGSQCCELEMRVVKNDLTTLADELEKADD